MTESNTAATIRIRAQIAERWPDLFNPQAPVPLAIGIHEALHEAMPDTAVEHIRRSLIYWCRRPRYLEVLIAGADRHGLEGVQGSVTEEQAADAAQQLKQAKAQFQEQHAAKQQAEAARQATAKKKAAKPARSAKSSPPPPKPARATPAKPASAAAKPAAPIIMVKKRRLVRPSTD
jgi:sRNA-binding protein